MGREALRPRRRFGRRESRHAVLRLQRSVLRRMQAEVRAHTGGHPPALERYRREYLREFRRYQRLSSYGELHQALLDADLVFIGDYHTLRQAQQVALQLVERAAADTRPVCLALEMIHAEHQPVLAAYMQGQVSEAQFLQAIRYRHTWNFDWANYRPLFEAARRGGVRVLGINQPGRDIRERDARIADCLVEHMRQEPQARLLVLIGDMHLASNHLPRAIDRRLAGEARPRRRLIVYQNSDNLYWDLARRGSEVDTQVVCLGRDRYCVMEVPPFVKLQSYLGWEQLVERGHDGEIEDEPTYAQLLEHLVRQLCAFMDLAPVGVDGAVYANLDEAFFDALQETAAVAAERVREIRLHAFTNRSCFVPELDLVYLPFFSVNHAAEEAMHIVMARHGGHRLERGDDYESFYARVLWAALGYAGSRIVNPRRRTSDEAELRVFLSAASRRLHDADLSFRKLVARFVLQHRAHERARRLGRAGRLHQIYVQHVEVRLEVTQMLGSMLGDRLAEGLRLGVVPRRVLRELVLAGAESPSGVYFALADRMAQVVR